MLCIIIIVYIDIMKTTIYEWENQFQRLEGAYATETVKCYLVDVKIFISWCQDQRLNSLPADVATIRAFLESQAPHFSVSTIQRRLYAIRKIHRLLHLPDPTLDEDIRLALRRIKRAKFERPKQAKGITREYLDAFLGAQPATPIGLRDRAMISLGYDLLARRSELVALHTSDIEFRIDGTLRVLIRRSKSDPYGRGRLAFTSNRTAWLVKEWLDWRGLHIEPLFCPIYQNKAINRALSATSVTFLIKDAAKQAGLSDAEINAFSGHSLRVGAAQDLLILGHDIAAIMRAGGWKSINALGRYLELAEHNVWL